MGEVGAMKERRSGGCVGVWYQGVEGVGYQGVEGVWER